MAWSASASRLGREASAVYEFGPLCDIGEAKD